MPRKDNTLQRALEALLGITLIRNLWRRGSNTEWTRFFVVLQGVSVFFVYLSAAGVFVSYVLIKLRSLSPTFQSFTSLISNIGIVVVFLYIFLAGVITAATAVSQRSIPHSDLQMTFLKSISQYQNDSRLRSLAFWVQTLLFTISIILIFIYRSVAVVNFTIPDNLFQVSVIPELILIFSLDIEYIGLLTAVIVQMRSYFMTYRKYEEFEIIKYLLTEIEGDRTSVQDIRSGLEISQETVVSTVNALEKEGLLDVVNIGGIMLICMTDSE